MVNTVQNRIKDILLKKLDIKHINWLRRLKWFILNNFADDRETIEKFYYEELEVRILEKIIPYLAAKCPLPPAVIDIGANVGAYSYYLADIIREFHGQCIGFEPRSDIFEKLVKNVKKDNFIGERSALSDRTGSADLHLPATHENSSLVSFDHFAGFKTERVSLSTLDNYISSRHIPYKSIIFIKIDVEGHELETLRGGRTAISRGKPLILCESENRHLMPQNKNVRMVIDLMEDIGYSGYVISKKSYRLLPIARISIPHGKSTHNEYFYNFWFLPDNISSGKQKIEDILNQIHMENPQIISGLPEN
ncbi:MAG: FkbM family methyltransferase [Nitrospirae bacterium]|nr:FkbM family methyltransferase [Nitrospirota bacterium]